MGLPYPTGTDKVVDGDNAIRALAEAVDALLNDTGWINLPAASNGFVADTGGGTPQYRKIGSVVYLRGQYLRSTAPATATVATTLPTGFRPTTTVNLHTQAFNNGDVAVLVTVNVSGTISITCGTARASSPGYTLTGVDFTMN